MAERIRGYQSRYDLDSIVIDRANKQAVEEMRGAMSYHFERRTRLGRANFIEIMNGEFIRARNQAEFQRSSF